MRKISLAALLALAMQAPAQVTTAFTYQGELEQGGVPASGSFDFEFRLYDQASGSTPFAGPVNAEDVLVDGGLFATEVDFGMNVFGLMDLWLEIRVREGASTGGFTILVPRQKLNPAPLAQHALNVEPNAVGPPQLAPGAVAAELPGAPGLLIEGASGAIPAEGSGKRFMWYPGKHALRAGRVSGNQWDDVNTGEGSIAMGETNTASGTVSFAVGVNNIASGSQSVAIGEEVTASGLLSMAIGTGTEASGDFSLALGTNTVAAGEASTAMGEDAEAMHDGSFVWGDSNSPVFSSSASDQFLIRAGGGVGIGTNAPSHQLDVAGTIASTGNTGGMVQIFNPDNQGSSMNLNWSNDVPRIRLGGTGAGSQNGMDIQKGGDVSLMRIQNSGDVTIAGMLTENSDRRYKTDIAPLGATLDELLAIEPVRYRFKPGTGYADDEQIGLIAQDVQAAFPELVLRDDDGDLSVAYSKLSAVLLKAVQEQQEQIETLKDELRKDRRAQAERIAALRADLRRLRMTMHPNDAALASNNGSGD